MTDPTTPTTEPVRNEPATEGTRICAHCRVEKPVTEFNVNRRNPLGRSYYCRVCAHAIDKAKRAARKEGRTITNRMVPGAAASRAEKQCGRCGEAKPITEFGRNASRPDGLQTWCKTCRAEQAAERKATEAAA